MPDFLDHLLTVIDEHEREKAVSLVKTADGYRTVPNADLPAEYGELTEIAKHTLAEGTDREYVVPVYEQKVSDADLTAQAERATASEIAAKSDGAVTMPEAWKSAGLTDADFADPTNYRLPIHDADHAKASVERITQEAFRKSYSDAEIAAIEKTLETARTTHGIATPGPIEADPQTGDLATKSTVTVAGVTLSVTSETDIVGPVDHYAIDGADAVQSFVKDGRMAVLHYPGSMEQETVRGIITGLSGVKSATRKATGDEFAEAMDNALDELGMSAMSSAFYAFLSCVASYWDGLDTSVEPEIFQKYTQQLASVLQQIWTAFTDDQFVTLHADLRRMKLAQAGNEKAGARLSRDTRSKVEAAMANLKELLGDDDGGDKTADPDGKTKSVGGTHDSTDAAHRSELAAAQEKAQAQVDRLSAQLADVTAERDRAKKDVTDRDELLAKLGSTPAPDPLREDAKPVQKAVEAPRGSVYELVPSNANDFYGGHR